MTEHSPTRACRFETSYLATLKMKPQLLPDDPLRFLSISSCYNPQNETSKLEPRKFLMLQFAQAFSLHMFIDQTTLVWQFM